jgi:hypothetical protein
VQDAAQFFERAGPGNILLFGEGGNQGADNGRIIDGKNPFQEINCRTIRMMGQLKSILFSKCTFSALGQKKASPGPCAFSGQAFLIRRLSC